MEKLIKRRLSKRFYLLVGFALCIAFVVAWLLLPVHVLQATDDEEHLLSLEPVQAGMSILYNYTHSVEKCPMQEQFFVGEQFELILHTSWNCNFGAGIASELPKGSSGSFKDGSYVMENINQVIPALFLHPVKIANQTLTVGPNTWRLSEHPFVGKTITIKVDRQPRYEYLMNKVSFLKG